MDLHLRGSVFLITGGTDGLGAALAERLLEEGANVAVCGRDPERLEATRAKLATIGDRVLAVRADVTRPDELAGFVSAAVERWQRIDGLVNNAGRSASGGIEQISDEAWTADLDLKLLAAVRTVRLVLPHLRAAGGGSIVNVLAVAAKAPGAGSMPSSTSRAAGMAMTKALSKELGPEGIRVNALLIGLIESGQWVRRAAESGRSVDEVYADLVASNDIPLGRVGRSDEFADLAAFLLSSRASYLTGTAINLDGGSSPVV
jgi:NAD(P)-dependent dehydrogenase (short-subunit alcohol dehydrogenase family)